MKKGHFKQIVFIVLLIAYPLSLIPYPLSPVTVVHAEVLDRIVAIVNNEIILQSELNDSLRVAGEYDPGVSGKKVLNDMIERILLLQQAKKLKLDSSVDSARDDDALLKEYIERRVRAFIHIPVEEIEYYYNSKRQEFGGNDFYEVKDEIEGRLVEAALGEKLTEHIEELKKDAYIRIQLED